MTEINRIVMLTGSVSLPQIASPGFPSLSSHIVGFVCKLCLVCFIDRCIVYRFSLTLRVEIQDSSRPMLMQICHAVLFEFYLCLPFVYMYVPNFFFFFF